MSQMHYLPLAPGFFAILVGFFFIVLILRSVRYAYESLGVSSNTAIFLLLATLIGSFFNIPIMELSPERALSHHHVDFFGMRYAVPAVGHWKGTLVAVNVGGAVIPTLMSIYLLSKRDLWVKGLLATAIVALVIHWMASRLGIAHAFVTTANIWQPYADLYEALSRSRRPSRLAGNTRSVNFSWMRQLAFGPKILVNFFLIFSVQPRCGGSRRRISDAPDHDRLYG
jgi:Protein of unknown function (DUF1614)